MAKTSVILSLALTFLVLSPGSLAQSWWWGQSKRAFPEPRRLQRGQQFLNDCNLHRLSAREPSIRIEAEAGVSEFWDSNQQEFRCVGVTLKRDVIKPRGLFLPHYVNTPAAFYVVQGNGLLGSSFPGCPETFESGSEPFAEERVRGSERVQDRHQRVRRLRCGDVIAVPPGVSNWYYNDGDTPLVIVALYDLNNVQNQLDLTLRDFFLAGNPQQSESQSPRLQRHVKGAEEVVSMGNIFRGFDEQFLADSFNVDRETIQRIQGQTESRGHIIRVDRDLEVVCPEQEEDYRRRREGRFANGLEETFCSAKIIENIDRPNKADIYNPEGGRLTFLNRNKLPILSFLGLSIDKGLLYQNAIMSPHWGVNAHRVHYFTRGSGRIQVACERGQLVFDDVVREGQLLVIPQNFVVLKQAGQEGLEWVVFNTNCESMLGTLAGRLSAIRALPEEVVMNSYGVSREDARRLKFSREESHFFQASPASPRIRQAVEAEDANV